MGRGETNAKKRKRQAEASSTSVGKTEASAPAHATIVTDEPQLTKSLSITKGRPWTVSIALPGSILASARTLDQRTALAGHIARATGVFNVDEVVVFNDGPLSNGVSGDVSNDQFLVHLLSYLETPPHLRKHLFPLHPNLESAEQVSPVDLPHHHVGENWMPYREGVTLLGGSEEGTLVEAGLKAPVSVEAQIPPNTRVTLKFDQEAKTVKAGSIRAEPVSPDEPREEAGLYWGFKVRKAESLSSVFTECEYEDGYDVSIGVSEHGYPLEQLYDGAEDQRIEGFKHLAVVFGGSAGLQDAVTRDTDFKKLGVKDAKDVFDRWVNVLPGLENCHLRTEESTWIGMTGLRKLIKSND